MLLYIYKKKGCDIMCLFKRHKRKVLLYNTNDILIKKCIEKNSII